MSDYAIDIIPTSRVIIFQGSLKKAPQLNKRGRKKWKDRFIALRANKTLECYKTKKAMDTFKSPRKVIDLRECINLEVGLEYKELQHIFSLGTFKRTFFFATPSDALMLQWVDNIEKVKNAADGDRIRILDIGLRRSPIRTITSMCGSQSMSKIAALCSSNVGSNHTGSTISHGSMSDGERSPSLPPQGTGPCLSPKRVSNDQRSPPRGSQENSPNHHVTSPSHQRNHTYHGSPTHHGSPSHCRNRHYINVAPRATPPPSRPVSTKSSIVSSHHAVTPKMKGKIPPPKIASKTKSTPERDNPDNPFDAVKAGKQQLQEPKIGLHGMKQSFRYRQIPLKKEKTLFAEVKEEDEDYSSDEETEKEGTPAPLYRRKELARSSPNLSEIGRPKAGRIKNVQPQELADVDQSLCPATSYSKVTVVGVKVQDCPLEELQRISVDSIRNSISEGALNQCSVISPKLPLEIVTDDEEVVLPERYSMDTFPSFDTGSVSSLDGIVVAPPVMFNETPHSKPLPGKKSKMQHQQTINDEDKEGIEKAKEKDSSVQNRNSTESSDTGYTSSPQNNERNGYSDVEGSPLPHPVVEKNCVPMVFYTKRIWKPQNQGKGLLGIQVCLVEQEDSLVQDLLALKDLEGYKLVECEVEEGNNTVSTPTGDALTVETSLEDLEFGFKVVKSTQKDLFNEKVKAFDFEIKNLFSDNKKPFSCEVHIKHLSDVIILPVELD
jgi:hypothetical protein